MKHVNVESGPPGKVSIMVSDELMQEIMSLDVEDRRQVFFALLNDPELNINPFDAINVRQNGELALQLASLLRGGKNDTIGFAGTSKALG